MIFTHTAHSNSKFRGIGIYYISIYLIVMKWLKWCILFKLVYFYSSGQWQRTKNPPANAGDIRDVGLTPGSQRSPGGGPGNPLQYSCLENPMDRGTWRIMVHRVTNSWTRLKRLSMHAYHRKGSDQLNLKQSVSEEPKPFKKRLA